MKCTHCNGRGWNFVVLAPDDLCKDPCDECDGTGEVEECLGCDRLITKEEHKTFGGYCAKCENEIVDAQEDRANDYD